MNFNSLGYLVFFPVITILYFLLPVQKLRNALLLVASYFFYMCWNPKYIILMFLCTLVTYLDGIFIGIAMKEE
ncbi:MAG: MBOAT family protein, partial [Lachnospiraceae bacterium]